MATTPPLLHDPACGTGAFLAHCPRDLTKFLPLSVEGFALAAPAEAITQGDPLLEGAAGEEFDIVLTNPPYSGQADEDGSGHPSKLKNAKTELLFTTMIADRLRAGGRACVLLPTGFAFGSSRQHQTIRKRLVEMHRLEGIIGIPGGAFSPYAGLNTIVVIFSKGTGRTDSVWMEETRHVGYTLNRKRKPTDRNDLPGAALRFARRTTEQPPDRGGTYFFVTADEIRREDYNLSFSRFQRAQPDETEYDSPEDILRSLMIGQRQIDRCLDDLAELTGCSFRTKDFKGDEPDPLDKIAEALNLDVRVSDFSEEGAEAETTPLD